MQNCCPVSKLGRLHTSIHFLDIRHHTSRQLLRYFNHKFIYRFQKHIFAASQPLPHSPVSRLSEITALCMLLMRTTCDQRNLHVCNL